MHLIEEIKLERGIVLKRYLDPDPQSPREWGSNFGIMVCGHTRYTLGDKQWPQDVEWESYEEFRAWIKKDGGEYLPLYLYDHSGISMSSKRVGQYADLWDSGQVGFIYVTAEKIRKEYSVKRISKAVREKAISVLEQEVETYDEYLTGQVYGYEIEDEDETHLDSCWGFYGEDYFNETSMETALYHVEESRQFEAETGTREAGAGI